MSNDSLDLLDYLNEVAERDAQKINFAPGRRAKIVMVGKVEEFGLPIYHDQLEVFLRALTEERNRRVLQAKGTAGFSFEHELGEFRGFINHGHGISLSYLPKSGHDAGQWPKRWRYALERQSGLLLITGPKRSGKTTALASLMRELPREMALVSANGNYLCKQKANTMSNVDCTWGELSVAAAIESILPASPDVIVVDDLNDAGAICEAIRAAQRGHFVLATLAACSMLAVPSILAHGLCQGAGYAYEQADALISRHLVGMSEQRLVRSKKTPESIIVPRAHYISYGGSFELESGNKDLAIAGAIKKNGGELMCDVLTELVRSGEISDAELMNHAAAHESG